MSSVNKALLEEILLLHKSVKILQNEGALLNLKRVFEIPDEFHKILCIFKIIK